MLFVINSCRCAKLSFAQLLELRQQQGLDYFGVQKATGAGALCKHCRPWLKQAFETGISSFTEDSTTLRNGEILLHHFHPNSGD